MGELEAMILITGKDGVAKGWRLQDVRCTETYAGSMLPGSPEVEFSLFIRGRGERLDVDAQSSSLIQQWRGEIRE